MLESSISLLLPPENTPALLRAKVKQIETLIVLAALFTQPPFVWRISKAFKGRAAPHCTGMQGGSLLPSSSAKSQQFCYHRAGEQASFTPCAGAGWMGIWPEPHRAVQRLWNAQLQPLNPVPLLLYSTAFRALVISAQPSSWQTSPIGELMFNTGSWSGLGCASASSPLYQDVVEGCSAEPAKGLILSQRHHQELGVRARAINAQKQKELNTELFEN